MSISKKKIKNIGIICSGGNSPAMNNTVITIVNQALKFNYVPYLIQDGYYGATYLKPILADPIYLDNFVSRGNAVNGSARFEEFANENIRKITIKNLQKNKIDLLIVIGGDGSYQGACSLSKMNFPVVCLPGTIDNDIASTDYSIGFDTCLQQIVLSIDAIKDSFSSHNGICFVEVMGRHYSDLAIRSCIANNAQYVVTDQNILTAEQFAKKAKESTKKGVKGIIFVITENIYGKNGLPPLNKIVEEVGKLTGNKFCRSNVLGYIQRGGVPTATDRFYSSLLGAAAIDAINQNKINVAVGIKKSEIIFTEIDDAVNMPRKKHNMYFLKD